MARKKGTHIGEKSREGLTDQRYNNPQDARIQKKNLDKALSKLRKPTTHNPFRDMAKRIDHNTLT